MYLVVMGGDSPEATFGNQSFWARREGLVRWHETQSLAFPGISYLRQLGELPGISTCETRSLEKERANDALEPGIVVPVWLHTSKSLLRQRNALVQVMGSAGDLIHALHLGNGLLNVFDAARSGLGPHRTPSQRVGHVAAKSPAAWLLVVLCSRHDE